MCWRDFAFFGCCDEFAPSAERFSPDAERGVGIWKGMVEESKEQSGLMISSNQLARRDPHTDASNTYAHAHITLHWTEATHAHVHPCFPNAL